MQFTSLTVLLIALFFYLSCGKDDCDRHCYITHEEEAFLSLYHRGDFQIFKNNTTGEKDTLNCESADKNPSGCSSPCNWRPGRMALRFTFSGKGKHLKDFTTSATYATVANISYENLTPLFLLTGQTQSVEVNGSTYNDAFEMSIAPASIPDAERYHIPSKICYSKASGFVCFEMANGDIWSRL